MRRTAIVVAAFGLLLAACGGDEATASATPEVVDDTEQTRAVNTDIEDPATDEGDTGADDADDAAGAPDEGANEGADDEELALAFADCMRDNGVDMEDPTINADGSINLFSGNPPGGAGGVDDTTQAAFDACGPILEDASFVGAGLQDPEFEDMLLEVAQCLRDQGLDVDDPDLQAVLSGQQQGGVFGPDFDPDDPANADAIDECSTIFAGFVPGEG